MIDPFRDLTKLNTGVNASITAKEIAAISEGGLSIDEAVPGLPGLGGNHKRF